MAANSSTWSSVALGPWDLPGLDVQGHRGARGDLVESTLASFLRAAEVGCRSVEVDVHLTADGVPVVWHDPVLSPQRCVGPSDVVGHRIDELTRDQLRSVDAGSVLDARFPNQQRVPGAAILSLESLLRTVSLLHPQLWWTVELKCDPTNERDVARRRQLVEAVVEVLHRTDTAAQALVHSFDWSVLRIASEVDASITRSALYVQDGRYSTGSPWAAGVDVDACSGDLALAAQQAGAHVVCPWFADAEDEREESRRDTALPLAYGPALVARAHELGLAVIPWTVNHPADLRAVVECGVDGLITDFPERALEVAQELGRVQVPVFTG